MKKHTLNHTPFILFTIIFIFSGCMTVRDPLFLQKSRENRKDGKTTTYFKEHPVLHSIYELHEIDELPGVAGQKFVTLYLLTLKEEYLPIGNMTFCTRFFYDYFTEIGYSELLDKIKQTEGKNMVEKAMNYAEETGEIMVLLSGYEAQKLANKGRDVGVLGEYYYDKAEQKYTVHYSVVQASNIAFDEEGNMVPYWVTGLITKRKDANDRYGTGTFLAQAGIANGLIDFRWAYNTKLNGIIQKDSKGNFRGGIIFIVFPEKKIPILGLPGIPVYSLTVMTEPAEALVYIDGVYRGTGPCTVQLLRKGKRTVAVTYPGYKEKLKEIILGEMKKPTLYIKLEEQKGSIHITTEPEKAKVFISGKEAGTTPCDIPGLPVGEYKISIQLPGYVSVGKIVNVEQDMKTDVHCILDKYEMIMVKGGNFQQGGNGILPARTVHVDDFYINKYEITYEQYESFCTDTGKLMPGTGEWGNRSRPVTGVDWYDAVEYCNWLSLKENLTPCYEIKKNEPDPDNKNANDTKKWTVTAVKDANGYRLPTEAEWEYAAKGGAAGKGYLYAGSNEIDPVAWYNGNSGKKIQPVGQKQPNELGLYDMSGNVWEWCGDWYEEMYSEQSSGESKSEVSRESQSEVPGEKQAGTPGENQSGNLVENPSGPGEGTYRVRKGGSAFNTDDENGYLRVSSRNYLEPDRGNGYTGFRVVRRIDAKKADG
ncbi:MAG: SUMF1/EgtB/PvdO family nonheme iron enzyme [Spirochaetales bacterium]|nr:SUMF1/EgtB/PvdO family nonheme iron enzyme [Spirochaetales bacterium]